MNNLMNQINEVINDLQNNDADYKVILNTIIACKEALEQPAQEPVAWRVLLDESPEDTDWHYMTGEPWECFKQSAEPLYTHPAPSWQGLSDDEINDIKTKTIMGANGMSVEQLLGLIVSLTEQTLRNKNGY